MSIIDFDNKIIEHLKNVISESLDYAKNSIGIDTIYIYISFEWTVYFDVLYKLGNSFYERHKLNQVIKNSDISVPRQKVLIEYCNKELTIVKELFIKDNRELPTQMKIIYFPKTGKFENKLSYKLHHNDELFIGDMEVAEEWFKGLQAQS